LLKSSLKKINTALASLELGLAEEELDFLGNLLFEDSPDFILGGDELFNTLLIFRTQEDSKVDDLICLPLQNQEFDYDDPLRPVIPDDTHPNCRCYYENADTGENLGQDGAFATGSLKRVTEEFADMVDGKEGVWKTVRGTPVFFPDGEDGGEAIKKAFKNKPKAKDKPKSIFKDEDDLSNQLTPDMTVEELKESSRRNTENLNHHEVQIKRDVRSLMDDDFSTETMSTREIKQGVKETLDPHGIAYDQDIEFEHSKEELKGMWNEIGEERPDIQDRFVEMERGTVRGNEETKQLFEKSPTFFRGTDSTELDGYLEDGLVGSKKFEFEDPDERFTHKFDFTAVSPHREQANHYSNGVTIEFEGDGVRKHGTPVEYDMFWRDFGARSESVDGGMHTKYMDHNEVRMPTSIPLGDDDLKIKNIILDDWIFHADFTENDAIEKYSKLGNVIIEQ
jgi:hypothetical protein